MMFYSFSELTVLIHLNRPSWPYKTIGDQLFGSIASTVLFASHYDF